MKKIFIPTCVIIVCAFASFFMLSNTNQETQAADFSQFKAGNIMTDYVMSNKNTMSESDISNFIRSKITCNKPYDSEVQHWANKGLSYHVKNGYVVCIADEYEWFGNKTAANIIYHASQDYSINPQVLLVLLQKEQGLLADKWPNSKQYNSATGYACPDTAACDPSYSGFEKQVRSAAALYREVLSGGWTNYPVGWNYIQYNEKASCGGSNVYIENRATSALYRFTPYQPNAATLSVPMGQTPDEYCGAYGNKNFYGYFTDWFGSTQVSLKTAYVPNGEYYIASMNDLSKFAGFQANDNSNGSKLKIFDKNSGAVKIRVTQNTDKTYSIVNVSSGKALDVPNSNAAKGTQIEQYSLHSNKNQKWNFVINNDGSFEIIPDLQHSLTLDLYGSSTTPGTNIQLWDRTGNKNQKWMLIPVDQPVDNGTYTVASKLNQNSVIDIYGGNTASGSGIQIWGSHGGLNQRWNFTYDDKTGYYTILGAASSKSLDVYNANTTRGTKVQIWSSHNGCSQKWRVEKHTDGSVSLLSGCSNLALDLYASNTASGSTIQLWDKTSNNNQKWTLVPIDKPINDGVYSIASKIKPGSVIDVIGGNTARGTGIQLWDSHNGSNQRWKFIYDDKTGYYSILGLGSNRSLDVYNGNKTRGTKVQLWDSHNGCSQKWRVEKHTDGSVSLLSGCSNLALDLYASNTTPGSTIQLWDRTGNNNQKWTLVPIDN